MPTPPTPIHEPEPVQASDAVEDESFADLTDVSTSEFELNNGQSSAGEIESLRETAWQEPTPEPPIAEDAPANQSASQTSNRRDDRSYRDRRDDLRSLKQVAAKEFKAKGGEPKAESPPPPSDSKEEFGEGIETWKSVKGESNYEGAKDNSNPVQEFVEADQANRNEMGELLGAHARWIDQHTRFLESQRL